MMKKMQRNKRKSLKIEIRSIDSSRILRKNLNNSPTVGIITAKMTYIHADGKRN